MSVYVPPRPVMAKAGPVGPGAGPLMTEFLLPTVLNVDPRKKMAQAVTIGVSVAYVRLAEQVISTKIADPLMGVAWHLEDPDGDTIDDAYDGDPRAKEAYALVDRPMEAMRGTANRMLSREDIWEITSRHMGLAGNACWYLDSTNDFGIPTSVAYLRPDRLEPDIDSNGQQTGWVLDRRPGYDGKKLDMDEVVVISIQTPDEGIWAPGLVESAMAKVMLNGNIDKHFAQVIAGGGRLSGIVAPKAGNIPNDQQGDAVYNQIVRDWRNVTEQPESARRLQVVRAPVDFIKTVLSPDELKLIDLMEKNRDDILAVWRVPLSQIGGETATGLNSGDVRKYDEAALWQNAVTPRLSRINTAIQTSLLDPFAAYIGWAPKLVLDIPEFDDDSPRYDKVQKSQFAPLLNKERRAQLGYPTIAEALGVESDPRDDDIIMSATQLPYQDLGKLVEAQAGLAGGEESEEEAAEDVPAKARSGYEPKYVFGRPNPHYAGGQGRAQHPGRRSRHHGLRVRHPRALRPKRPPHYTRRQVLKYARNRPVSWARFFGVMRGAYAKATDLVDLEHGKQSGPEVTDAVVAALRKQWTPSQAAVVAQGTWKYDPKYPMSKIDDSRRPGGRNMKIVDGIQSALEVGAPIDPVIVVKRKVIGKKGTEPIDGWHRTLAANRVGLDTIPAFIGEGDEDWTNSVLTMDDHIPRPELVAENAPLAKAEFNQLRLFRSQLEQRMTPQLKSQVRRFLAAQRDDVAARIRGRWEEVKRAPKDTSLWWQAPNQYGDPWNNALTGTMAPVLTDVARQVDAQVRLVVPAKAPAGALGTADPRAVRKVLDRGAARVSGINETTREAIKTVIAQSITDGLSAAEAGDAVQAATTFDEYRSELIARTELMDAYNAAALGSYADMGVEYVQAIDGIGDEECADRNNNIYPIDEADTIEDHPNGTLDWVPVLAIEWAAEEKAEPVRPKRANVNPKLLRDLVEAMDRQFQEEREAREAIEAEAKADRQRYIDTMERWQTEDAKAKQTPIVVNMPEQPPAQITVNVPEHPAPVVNVKVPKQEPAVVNFTAPLPPRTRKVLDRDPRTGAITGAHDEDEG